MGNVGCCKTESEEAIERKLFISPSKQRNNNNNNNPIIDLPEQTAAAKIKIIENNNELDEIDEENLDDLEKLEKIKKIQNKYRSYQLKKKFDEIKPMISQKTTNFIKKFYQQCELGGETAPDEDFSSEGWKNYYPKDERFFLYQKGNVFPNQIRIKNADDPDNLEIYEGETDLDNLKHGFGTLTTPHYKLKGSWRKDEFTGWGRKSMRNGDILEGKFVNGELNGKGIFKNKDSIYVGDFINSIRWGKGDLSTKKFHYIGDFNNNKLNGIGMIDFLNEGHHYEGSFQNNEINGRGIYKWKNGEIYEGEMKNGKMDGYGKYTYDNDQIYEGEFVNGIKQGKGKMTYPSNKIYEGNFNDGVPDGEGFYTKDGNTKKVLFSKGKFVKYID